MAQGKTLRVARERARMTQEHLAEAAGLSARTVMRAERGDAISAEALRSLCSVLGLDAAAMPTPDDAVRLDDTPSEPTPSAQTQVATLGERVGGRLGGVGIVLIFAAMSVVGVLFGYGLSVHGSDPQRFVGMLNSVVGIAHGQQVRNLVDGLARAYDHAPPGMAPPVSQNVAGGRVTQVVADGDGTETVLAPLPGAWQCCEGSPAFIWRLPDEGWLSWQFNRAVFNATLAVSPLGKGSLSGRRVPIWLRHADSKAAEVVIGPLDGVLCREAVRALPLRLSARTRYAVTISEEVPQQSAWAPPRGEGDGRDVAGCSDRAWLHLVVGRAQ